MEILAFNRRLFRLATLCCRALALVALLLPIAALAQGPMDAALRGRVLLSPTLGPTAEIVLRSADGLEVSRVQPGRNGVFFLLHLQPGVYTLEGIAPGPTGSTLVQLDPGEITEVTLDLASRTQSSASLQVPQAQTLAEALAPAAELTLLPITSRSFQSLAELSPLAADPTPANSSDTDDNSDPAPLDPSATRDTSNAGRAASGLSAAGLAVTSSGESVDGLTAMQYFRAGPRGSAAGGAAAETSFSQGAVRSLSTRTRDYTADSSGAGGVWTSIATRRGGPTLHGSAFALLHDGAWDATNPFSTVTHFSNGIVTNSLAQPGGGSGIFGGSLGAPVPAWPRTREAHARPASGVQPRLWLFASVEAQVLHDQLTSTPQLLSFYQLTPTQTTLLSVRGVSSAQRMAALNFLDSLTGVLHRSALRINAFGRSDFAPTRRDLLTLTYAAHRLSAPAGAAFGQSSDAVVARGLGSIGDRTVTADTLAAHWLHRFSSAFANEAGAQWSHELNQESPRAPLPQEPAIGPGGLAPQVSIAPNGFAYGTPSNLNRSAYPEETIVEAQDAFDLRLRTHLLRAGATWSRINDRASSAPNAEGSFSYDSPISGGYAGGLVDWITDFTYNVHAYPNGGCPSVYASPHYFCFHTFTQSFGTQQVQLNVHRIAAFAQDSWRLRDDLVLNAGARYEYTLLPFAQAPNFALDAAIASLARPDTGATATMPEDRNNLGPRLSLAWSPSFGSSRSPWFIARLGYGVFYGVTPGATIAAALTDTALPSSVQRIRIRPTTITQCPQVTTVSQGFGYPCDYTSAPPAAIAQTTSALVFSSHFRQPTIQRGSLTLERSLGRHAWLRLGYAMANATQLATTADLNIAASTGTRTFVLQGGDGRSGVRDGEIFSVPFYTARPLSQYGAVSLLQSHANATFHAGTLEAGIRSWRGLTAHGSFAFSRAIDYNPQQGATPRLNTQFDPFRIGYDKGLSSLSFPWRVSAALEYRTPTEQGSGLRRNLTAGWTLGLVAVASSGAPYSYSIYGGSYLSAGGDSINGSGGATYLPTVGRNTLRLPARSRADLRLTRRVHLPRSMDLELFAQAFNLANTVSLSRVETRAFLVGTPATSGAPTPLIFQDAATVAAEGIPTPAFGTPLSSTTGLSRERRLELGLRLQF